MQLAWEYVAIFDADFEMPPDWLLQTIWHLERDKRLAFVQTRWVFTNGYDNMLCWCAHCLPWQLLRLLVEPWREMNPSQGACSRCDKRCPCM